jgi:hypothetical protein
MDVIVRTEPCGMRAYARLNVPHDWAAPPLNRCECGKAINRWSSGRGHECACGKTCNGACR